MITSLLIANRGEIACRVIRTARRLGIRTIAVYSDADAKALHVRMADEAVHIGPSPARDSYLRGDRIIEAAKEIGAEAIHPGYGFLSENADFAQAVVDAGLIWVGPKPDSIRAMGLKDAAKKLMAEAGVPVTPGYLGEDQDPKRLKAEAGAIGYPVLIKAVAGGGGKGMRRVDEAAGFDDALDSAKREAASSFGDDRVLIEKYITSPRHIEVQVFGDSFGHVVHLFERDCSLQRRHQKVIEEAPAPGMDAETREAVCGAAVRAAKAVNYENAGTIEFIADATEGLRADRIWFMEMNTRLQVEHPVTEEITGQDLVEWQLRVASGEPLPKRQNELSITGHAIEARLYAEDPVTFLPSIGPLTIYRPKTDELRVETGYAEGDIVSPYYDPMIEKLIARAGTRDEAAKDLADACAGIDIWPVKTNAPLLWRALEHPLFLSGDITTGFIDAHKAELSPPAEIPDAVYFAGAVAAAVGEWQGGPTGLTSGKVELDRAGAPDVWREAFGFRLNAPSNCDVTISVDGRTKTVQLSDKWRTSAYYAEYVGDGWAIPIEGQWFHASLPQPRGTGTTHRLHDGEIEAPMPGKVTAVEVSAGEKVANGQRLLTLEAMKMEHALVAPFDGVVAELNAREGAQVTEGMVLARVVPAEE